MSNPFNSIKKINAEKRKQLQDSADERQVYIEKYDQMVRDLLYQLIEVLFSSADRKYYGVKFYEQESSWVVYYCHDSDTEFPNETRRAKVRLKFNAYNKPERFEYEYLGGCGDKGGKVSLGLSRKELIAGIIDLHANI